MLKNKIDETLELPFHSFSLETFFFHAEFFNVLNSWKRRRTLLHFHNYLLINYSLNIFFFIKIIKFLQVNYKNKARDGSMECKWYLRDV